MKPTFMSLSLIVFSTCRFYHYINYFSLQRLKQNAPKVWTLEDDYEKWKAVSAERGIAVDPSVGEASASSQEYDYEDDDEYDGDYSSGDYYYNTNPVDPGASSYQNSDDYSDEPNLNKNLPITPLSGNIEVANSRADAISAWKSLVAQEGYWKFANEANERRDVYPAENAKHSQERVTNNDRRSPTLRLRHEGNSRADSNGLVDQSYRYNSRSKLDKNSKLPITRNYDSYPESTKHNYDYQHGGKRIFETNPEYQDLKHSHQQNNLHGQINPISVRNDNDQNGQEDLRLRHTQFNTRNYEKTMSPLKNADNFSETHAHLQNKDRTKLESLISKLEAIQREAKGRAVIDLAALLNQMKARRNFKSTKDTDGTSDIQLRNHTNINHHDAKAIAKLQSGNMNTLSVKMEVELPNEREKYLQRGVNYETEKKLLKQLENNTKALNNNKLDDRRLKTGIRPKSHRFRHPEELHKSPGGQIPGARLKHSNAKKLPNNDIIRRNEHLHQVAERNSYKIRTTPAKPEKSVRGSKTAHSHRATEPRSEEYKNRESSEESVVDNIRRNKYNKPVISRRQRRPSRRNSRHHLPPVVMKGETAVEDVESGIRKSRKIIVIDYAGEPQQKRSSVDKKDLELIIKNIKHRRSELLESIHGGER